MILACWRLQWRPRGCLIEVVTCDEVISPGELPEGLSMLLSCGPRSLSATHWQPLLSLHIYAPLPVPYGPPAKGSACIKRDLSSWWTTMGLSTLLSWGPHSLLAVNYGPVLSFSPYACAGPKAAAAGNVEVGLPGELVRAQRAVILLPDPHHAAHGCHLSAHIQIVLYIPGFPQSCCKHTGSWNEVIAGCRAECWPGTCPLQLLTVYCSRRHLIRGEFTLHTDIEQRKGFYPNLRKIQSCQPPASCGERKVFISRPMPRTAQKQKTGRQSIRSTKHWAGLS